MHKMKDIQSDFVWHIFDKNREFDIDFDCIRSLENSSSIEDRLDVHRQTIFANLINNLKNIYPYIWKLIGEKCARGVAISYIHEIKSEQKEAKEIYKEYPKNGLSNSMLEIFPNLPTDAKQQDFGINFPEYLASFPSLKDIDYLADIAKLEWIRYRSYYAKVDKSINFSDLQNLSEEDLSRVVFKFNDSCFLLKSCYPLLDIQDAVDDPNAKQLSLRGDKNYFYLVYQKDYLVMTREINHVDFVFLEKLKNGVNFGIATEKCSELFPEFDLARIINLMIDKKIISTYSLDLLHNLILSGDFE